MKHLSRVDEEVRNARSRLLGEQHQRRCAITPDAKEDVVEHPSVLFFEWAADGVAVRLVSARRKEVRPMPPFAVENQPQVEACMYAGHQGDAEINAKGDLFMLALILSPARRGELATTNGHGLSMVAGEEAIKLIDVVDWPNEGGELVRNRHGPSAVDVISRPVAAHTGRIDHLRKKQN